MGKFLPKISFAKYLFFTSLSI